jgi:hypothetical protein
VFNMMLKIMLLQKLDADTAPMGGQYSLGTTFLIPDPTIDDEDKNLTADIKVNGTQLGTGVKTFRALTAGDYAVTFEAKDTLNVLGISPPLVVTVAADRPPCIGGTSPDANTQLLLTAVGETRRLIVTSVNDDLNPWPADTHGGRAYFQWLIDSGGGFRIIPNWTESYYDLDGNGYIVGDQVQVRVMVTDEDATHVPSCNAQVDACPTLTCPAWLTWHLEFYQ